MAAIIGDERTADGIPVEVKLNSGGYFPAALMDIIKGEALIHFPYNWMPEAKYNFSHVRFPPVESTPRSALKEKMIAEILFNKEQGYHKGWFKCSILMLKSEFCQFEYLDAQNIIDFGYIRNLRKLNMNPKLSMDMLHVHKIMIPEKIREFANCENVHRSFKNTLKCALVNYHADRGELVIISRNKDDILCAKYLESTHLKSFSNKNSIVKLAEKVNCKIQKTNHGLFTTEFIIPKSYLAQAIGKRKVHLRAAKNVKGVCIVQLIRKLNKFIIHGETEEAVQEARKLLEIKIELYPVLEKHMSQLVGRESANIHKILQASGALEIYIDHVKDGQEQNVKDLPLYIIGTAQAIENAELFIKFQTDHIYEVQRLRERKHEIRRQIREFVKTDTTTKRVLPRQTTSTPRRASFIKLCNHSMDEIKEFENLNELLLEDYQGAANLDVIPEEDIDLGDNTTDVNLENTTTEDINQEDLDLVDTISNGIAVLDFKSKPEALSSGIVYDISKKHSIADEEDNIQTRTIATQVQLDDFINLDTRTVATQTDIEGVKVESTSVIQHHFKGTTGITKGGEINKAETLSDTNGMMVTLCHTLIEVKSRYISKKTSSKSGRNGTMETLPLTASASSEIGHAVIVTKKRFATPEKGPIKTKKLKSISTETTTENVEEKATRTSEM